MCNARLFLQTKTILDLICTNKTILDPICKIILDFICKTKQTILVRLKMPRRRDVRPGSPTLSDALCLGTSRSSTDSLTRTHLHQRDRSRGAPDQHHYYIISPDSLKATAVAVNGVYGGMMILVGGRVG